MRSKKNASHSEQRTIRLDSTVVSYTLRRSPARRSYALQVDERGVRVAAPLRAAQGDLDLFIRRHATWLLDKLTVSRVRAHAREIAVADGALFPLLGETCRLRFVARTRGASWQRGADGVPELWLAARADPLAGLLKALKQRTLMWFTGRVEEYCHRLGVNVPAVRLSSATTRWGSCSLKSGIRVHWRLAHLPPSVGDYVVAHEVAHLLEMNHSPRFWALVERIYPDWRAARATLRLAGDNLPVFVLPAAAALSEQGE